MLILVRFQKSLTTKYTNIHIITKSEVFAENVDSILSQIEFMDLS